MKSLYINNYKNINELSIESLASINLIVGRNNVGKSTLLEAISIYAANGSDEQLKEILNYRDESIEGAFNYAPDKVESIMSGHFLSFFPHRKESYSEDANIIIGETNTSAPPNIAMYLVYIVSNGEKDEKGNLLATTMSEQEVAKNPLGINVLGKGMEVLTSEGALVIPFYRRIGYNPITPKMTFRYVRASDFQNGDNANLFDRTSLLPEYHYLIEALQIVEPRIEKLGFLTESNHAFRSAYVIMREDEQRYALSSMGDGMNRILTIILAMLNCKNGIFLLDEFETGLHYTVQTQLWEIIFMLAEKLNIQVFVTSHSQDCIHSFVRANKDQKGKLIRLEKRRDTILVVNYDDEQELKFAADNFIEMR